MYSIFAYKGKKQVHLQGCFVQWKEGFVQWWWGEGGLQKKRGNFLYDVHFHDDGSVEELIE